MFKRKYELIKIEKYFTILNVFKGHLYKKRYTQLYKIRLIRNFILCPQCKEESIPVLMKW
jgi:hypothetical protein